MIYGVYLVNDQDTVLRIYLTNDNNPRTKKYMETVKSVLGENLNKLKQKDFPSLNITYKEYRQSVHDRPFESCVSCNELEDVKSLRLPLFLSLYTDKENINLFDRIYITGNLERDTDGSLRCKEVKLVRQKLEKIIQHEQKENRNQNAAFFYVAGEEIDCKNKNIKLIRIEPETRFEDLLIQMKRNGRTENLIGLEKKIVKYVKDNNKCIKIENYISGKNRTIFFKELRDICTKYFISFSNYMLQPFSGNSLEPMIEYVNKTLKKESESWLSVVPRKNKIKTINNNLIETYKMLQSHSENEKLKMCWDSKVVLEQDYGNTLFVLKDDIPVILIKQIDDTTIDFEVYDDKTLYEEYRKIKNAYIPEIQSAETEILTFKNDPFARMTKKCRFENIFDSVFHKKIEYVKFFNSENKVKSFTSPKKFLNKQYGELSYKDLLQNGHFLETEFIFYETIDCLFQKRNPDCARRKDCKADCDKCEAKKECGYIDYFQKKKKADFILQSSDFDLLETIPGSSFTEDMLKKYLIYSMKGNSHDLSQNEALYHEDKNRYDFVCDDTQKIFSFLLQQNSYGKLIIIPDNSAVEFFSDICLAMYFLSTNKFRTIVFKMNNRPKFVSDVTWQDYELFKTFLKRDNTAYNIFEFYEKSGRIQFEYKDDYTQIPYIRDFSEEEIKDLQSADMLIVKGDLNYRRFLLDCFCPFETPLKSLVPEQLLEQKIVFLRMIKSTVVAGLTKIQSQKAHDEIDNPKKTKTDEDGLNTFFSSGNYGMISMIGY